MEKKKSSYQKLKDKANKDIRSLEKIIVEERTATLKFLFHRLPKIYGQPYLEMEKQSPEGGFDEVVFYNDSWTHPEVPNHAITWEMRRFPYSPYLRTLEGIIFLLEEKHKKS